MLNGMLERADWQLAIKMPIGIIPAGMFELLFHPLICVELSGEVV